ncbi:MAG: COX15/CtaA family protein [bacterium]
MSKGYFQLVVVTALLTVLVVGLGAYTRLADAGLGCPDWPGCYGDLLVPENEAQVENKAYLEQRPLEQGKAWKEMIHRYIAGTLGLLILAIAIWSWKRRREPGQPVYLPLFLLALVTFQAALGMWTVTLQLKPVVVMGHLLGGFTTLALLVLLALRVRPDRSQVQVQHRWRSLAGAALIMVIVQIALGGWTSANYAALACPDFPTCQGAWVPETDFKEGFVLWRGLGVNYEFGVLEHPARTAIHLAHRIGAVLTLFIVGLLAFLLVTKERDIIKNNGLITGILLLVQVGLGIANVVMGLPIGVAVAHNLVAALLLLSLIRLNYLLWRRAS